MSLSTVEARGESRRRLVDSLLEELGCPGNPGVAVGIYQNGHAVYLNGRGDADLEQRIPIGPRTVFQAASVSKQFTAFAIALLAREGRVDLDADVRRLLPIVPDFGHPMTVRHLILHANGLRDQLSLFNLGGHGDGDLLRQQQVLSMVARQQALNFKPGTDCLYSNTSYVLLAEIVRVVSSQTLRQFTSERIFRPLGMTRTFFCDDLTEVVPDVAHSYSKGRNDSWHRAPLNHDYVGPTSLLTTAEDLLKWAGNFIHPRVGDAELIEQISAQGMLDDGRPINYGFGLMRGRYAGHEGVWHSGATAAFRTLFACFPQQRFAVAILANYMLEDRDRLVDAFVDLYLNDGDGELGAHAPPAVVPDPVLLRELAGCYVTEFEPMVLLEQHDGRLLWRIPSSEPKLVVFRADGTFDLDNGTRKWRHFRVQRDPSGNVAAFSDVACHMSVTATLFRRIEPVNPTPDELSELTGDYHSAELDITYTLALEGGQLRAYSLWSAQPVVFTPSLRDRFDAEPYWMNIIQIVRDRENRPKGLCLQGSSMRNVWLEKVS